MDLYQGVRSVGRPVGRALLGPCTTIWPRAFLPSFLSSLQLGSVLRGGVPRDASFHYFVPVTRSCEAFVLPSNVRVDSGLLILPKSAEIPFRLFNPTPSHLQTRLIFAIFVFVGVHARCALR